MCKGCSFVPPCLCKHGRLYMARKRLWNTRCLRLRVALFLPVSQEYLSFHLHGNSPTSRFALLRKSCACNKTCCAAVWISLRSRRKSLCLISSLPCCSSTIVTDSTVTTSLTLPFVDM